MKHATNVVILLNRTVSAAEEVSSLMVSISVSPQSKKLKYLADLLRLSMIKRKKHAFVYRIPKFTTRQARSVLI